MTLSYLAKKIGRSKQYMSELANGNIRLKYETAVDIAKVFNSTPDEIFLEVKSNKIGRNHKGN